MHPLTVHGSLGNRNLSICGDTEERFIPQKVQIVHDGEGTQLSVSHLIQLKPRFAEQLSTLPGKLGRHLLAGSVVRQKRVVREGHPLF